MHLLQPALLKFIFWTDLCCILPCFVWNIPILGKALYTPWLTVVSADPPGRLAQLRAGELTLLVNTVPGPELHQRRLAEGDLAIHNLLTSLLLSLRVRLHSLPHLAVYVGTVWIIRQGLKPSHGMMIIFRSLFSLVRKGSCPWWTNIDWMSAAQDTKLQTIKHKTMYNSLQLRPMTITTL